MTCSCKLSALRVIASSFDWTMDCSASFVIGQRNYFGFGFCDTQLIENCSIFVNRQIVFDF